MSPCLPSSQPHTAFPTSASTPPPAHNTNFHPYPIRTTASSLLTRSNSSPTQPLDGMYRHRPSRSMSSLSSVSASSVSSGEDGRGVDKDRDRRRSAGGERIKRSRPVPAFLAERATTVAAEPALPLNPKDWSPSELALYLAHVLRTGGPDGAGPTLPPAVVADIRTWVMRSQVTGRTFLRGSAESWASGRPPPFLPVLQSLSRRLRRLSLGARPVPHTSSVLHEADETPESGLGLGLAGDPAEWADDADAGSGGEDYSRVRALAHVFDTIHSSDSADDVQLRPQHTGASARGASARSAHSGSGRSRRSSSSQSSIGLAADPADVVTPKRAQTGAAAASQARARRGSGLSALSAGDMADAESGAGGSPESTAADDAAENILTPRDGDGDAEDRGAAADPLATLRSPKSPTAAARTAALAHLYDGADNSPLTCEDRAVLAAAAFAGGAAGGGDAERTPPRPPLATLVPPAPAPAPGSRLRPPASPHMARMDGHADAGANPYGALRTASGRVPTLHSAARGTSSDESEPGVARAYSTARRVTLRPATVEGVFDVASPDAGHAGTAQGTTAPASASASPGSARRKTAREREMEAQIAGLVDRIAELEDRLGRVESGARAGAAATAGGHAGGAAGVDGAGVWRLLGYGAGDDALPRRVRELPAYLFLVGVGVGAIMVRVLVGRMARA
ncbi:hypothetical protein Q5752_006561 [Cryptotrichosporon argae]